MGWLKKLFCKHAWVFEDVTWICDTDWSGNYWEVLRCTKCGKYELGGLVPRKEARERWCK